MASESGNHTSEASDQQLRDLRVDAAHPMRRPADARPMARSSASVAARTAIAADSIDANDAEELALPPWPVADNGALLAASPLLLAQHATELAERLQLRLVDVDRREARLNSQEAEFDSRIRNARLWIDQREAELAETEQRLADLDAQLTARQEAAASQLEQAEEFERRLQELAEREQAVAALQIELELGRTEQQTKLDALDFEAAGCRTRQQELDQGKQRCEQRQRELDQREAKLYVEQERATHERLALDARARELDSRETRTVAKEVSLAEFERRLAEQAGEIEVMRGEIARNAAAQQDREAEVSAAERRLDFRQQEIRTALERFERLGIIEGRISEVEALAEELQMRANYLDSAETMLAERQLEMSQRQRDMEQDRLAFQNQVTRDRRALVAESKANRLQSDERSRELDRREAALDQREQALAQIGEQLRETQREALETRLAAEETWVQLQGVLAPAALTRSTAQVRSQLSEHYQLAADEVRQQRTELETIRRELAEQLVNLQEHRSELQRWAKNRELEIEEHAARLMAREAELDSQQQHFQAEQRRWESQRTEYQQEIQRLLAELRRPLTAAA